MTRWDHTSPIQPPARLPCRSEPSLLPRPWRQRLGGLDGAVRFGPPRARPRGGRHRSSEAKGRGCACRHSTLPFRGADVVVGGHSFGGRVASLAAAEPDAPYAALVLFSYPFHPPGQPERTDARIAHWPSIACPVLLLSGESDPFAQIDLLRAAVHLLPDAAARDVSTSRTRRCAGPRRRPRSCRRVPDGHRRTLTRSRGTNAASRSDRSVLHNTVPYAHPRLPRTDGRYPHAVLGPPDPPGRGAPPMSPSEAQVPRVR